MRKTNRCTPETWGRLNPGEVLVNQRNERRIVLSVTERQDGHLLLLLDVANGFRYRTSQHQNYYRTGEMDMDTLNQHIDQHGRMSLFHLGDPSVPSARTSCPPAAQALRPWPRVRGMFARLFGGRR